ncbi:hypothetical protein DFA_10052 [Cavenderia fasciculata]|uniref:Obg-like ATPase homolog n=1 Tax=Cavenderia fasciculata TaxID=261658 RepID=F4Q953_CACFS|nr:uncharacterized protein DFA_10052 [Cavenderia fasciculata]EGG15222.1 hypothetical protein DFA_10052 [Cavenderia fasciculata]|eukprot:XP_004351942.1 hypothetical protein DFA_10052 [Cavenderia fasciculata]
MSKKAATPDAPVLLGRVGNNLKMGLVGLPNVGKSSMFNILTNMSIPAENFPFCTIDPNVSRCAVPDERYDWLVDLHKPKSNIPAYLTITDIAGLVKGASTGAGLGNAFLSHIQQVDGIFHMIRAFDDSDIIHVEDTVDPVRDLEVIANELIQKDLEHAAKQLDVLVKSVKNKTVDKTKQQEIDTYQKVVNLLKEGKQARFGQYSNFEVEFIRDMGLITTKPGIYLVNLSEEDFIRKKNKYLAKIKTWVDANGGGPIIPISVKFEAPLSLIKNPEERKAYEDSKGAVSMLPKIIKTGYHHLQLCHFFTCGSDEVRCWTFQKGSKAPQCAGVIHTDFEKGFIMAETMAYVDFAEHKSEAACKAAGKWIIKQYNLNIQTSDELICNDVHFKCSNTTSGYHIININIINSSSPGSDMPDYNLKSFYFPELLTIQHKVTHATNVSINLLSLLSDLPNLFSLDIGNDPSISWVPDFEFFNLPKLRIFQSLSPIEKIDTSFNNTNIQHISLSSKLLRMILIDTTMYLPRLETLMFFINSTTPLEMAFTTKSFPLLNSVSINSLSTQKIKILHSSSVLHNLLLGPRYDDMDGSPIYEFFTDSPSTIKSISTYGQGSSLTPKLLDSFPNINYFTFTNSSLTEIPFTKFPTGLEALGFSFSRVQSIPTSLVAPNTLIYLDLSYNKIQGQFPWDTILKNVTKLYLSLRGNPGLSGYVPDTACSQLSNLFISKTAISSLPECFWCFPDRVETDIPYPTGFICNVVLSNKSLITNLGHGIIEGSNLGWGGTFTTYTIKPIVFNQKVEIIFKNYQNFYNPNPNPITIPLSSAPISIANASFTSIVEAGIDLDTITYEQRIRLIFFTFTFKSINLNFVHRISINSQECLITTTSAPLTIQCALRFSTTNSFFNTTGTASNLTYLISNGFFNITGNTKLILEYPIVRSISKETGPTLQSIRLTLFGNFGPFEEGNSIVLVHNWIACIVETKNQTTLVCLIDTLHDNYGLAPLYVNVDGANFTSSNMLYFDPPPPTQGNDLKSKCEQNTRHCYGHGQCQDNGQCSCDLGYSQLDNCLTKYLNETIPIETNSSSPVTQFNIDGVLFNFEMYSIQEIDSDGKTVMNEVIVREWTSNITTDEELTVANYVLISNETEANVTAVISFSSKPRIISFGDQQFSIDPNSIKVTVAVENWTYQSNIATLRVLFKTVVDTNQAVQVNCDQHNIDTFSYDSLGNTIQYLRVVKQGVQFTGRFINYVLSDGRSTYSQTQLVSLLPIVNKVNESIALIGVNFPQCQSCTLDPDFTPLIIDNSKVGECGGASDSKVWKIAVGVSVGGVVLIALVVGTIIYLKDSNRFRLHFAKNIRMKKV